MKKRLLTLFLVLTLVLSLFPAGVVSAVDMPEQTWSHLTVSSDGKTATGYCPHCDKDVTWNLYTRTSGHNSLTTSGHYFLNADSNMTGALRPAADGLDFVLHLNGKTFTRSGAGNTTGVIYTNAANTTFSIVDDQEQAGALCGEIGLAVNVNAAHAGTKIVLYSGNLVSNAAAPVSTQGGTVHMPAGTFEMYGGTVVGSNAVYGGAIYLSGNTVANIYGGTIKGGKATTRGGAIYTGNANNVVNIYGGTIENGTCLGDNAEGGGNIYAKGAVNIYGGTIQGGKSTKGGNIYALTAVTINGTAALKNGEATYGGNVYVEAAATLGAGAFEGGKATYGSDIYVGANAKNVVVDSAFNGTAGVYYALNHLPDGTVYNKTLSSQNSGNGAFSGKLYLENVPGRPVITKSVSGTSLLIASKDSAALVDKNGNYTWYAENNDAVAAYNDDTAYMVAGGASLPVTGGDYVIDLAGHNVTITGSGSVTLFDSANADYETYGTATVVNVAVNNSFKTNVAGEDYYMVKTADTKYTFHRMGVDIIGVSVRPSRAGMYYTGMWKCDDLLAAKVTSFGVAASVRNQPGEDFATDSDTVCAPYAEAFTSGATGNGVIITDIVKGNTYQNNSRSKKKVYAVAYVTFDEDNAVAIGGGEKAQSLYSTLQMAEDNIYAYASLVDTLKEFQDTWTANGANWDFDFTLTADELAILNAYEGTAAYHGEAHDHSSSGDNGDGKYSLNHWKQGLEMEGMDFGSILDHRQSSHMTDSNWDSTKFIGGSEASTNITDGIYADLTSSKIHYSMIFTDASKLDYVAKNTIVEWSLGSYKNYKSLYNYPDMTKAEFLSVIQAVKDNGGMFTIVHPKSDGYLTSDNAEDYYFADWTGLEVFYGAAGYAPTQAVNKDNYKLWTDLLALGKKVWATAGSDVHGAPNTNALTTIYSKSASATDIFSYMKAGNSTCGPVGIRMVVGDTQMGSQTDFAGKRVAFSVADFHESVYNPNHTYSVKLLSDTGVVYETTFDASQPFFYGMDADDSAAFYRVEVWDNTAGYALPIAIGNPIWNN